MKTPEEHYNEKHAQIKSVIATFYITWLCPKCGKPSSKVTDANPSVTTYYSRCLLCSQYVTFGLNPPKDQPTYKETIKEEI